MSALTHTEKVILAGLTQDVKVKTFDPQEPIEKIPTWQLVFDCLELVVAFIIKNGLKVKWYNPLIILEALRLIKKIVSLVIKYIKEKNNN